MLVMTEEGELVLRWPSAQAQAYFPYEQEKKHAADYCPPSLAALGLNQDSQTRRNGGLFHLIHLKGFCPLYAARLG